MVKLLLVVLANRVPLLEVGGAAAITGGVAAQWGAPVAWIAGGVFALLKAFELDLAGGDG